MVKKKRRDDTKRSVDQAERHSIEVQVSRLEASSPTDDEAEDWDSIVKAEEWKETEPGESGPSAEEMERIQADMEEEETAQMREDAEEVLKWEQSEKYTSR